MVPSGVCVDETGLAWIDYFLPLRTVVNLSSIIAAPTTIAFVVVSQWFRVNGALATGFVTLGAAVGGIMFSAVLQALFESLEWKWAVLALSGIILGFMALGNALVETYPVDADADGPLHDRGDEMKWEGVVVSSMLRSTRFWLVSYAVFGEPSLSVFLRGDVLTWFLAYELVLFIQWGSIPTYAVYTDFGDKQFYLMMSYNM